jgi:hypothetical protein
MSNTVRMPSMTEAQRKEAMHLAVYCAKIGLSSGVTAQNIDTVEANANINECVRVMKTGAKAGRASDFQAFLLAVRQQEPTSSGRDNAKELAQRLTDNALAVENLPSPASVSSVGSCAVAEAQCNQRPITHEEVQIIFGATNAAATPAMNPSRALPITRATAAINGFGDAVMSPERALNKGDGSAPFSLAEKVDQIHQKHTAQAIDTAVKLCIKNDPSMTIPNCAKAGVRMGLEFALETGIRYDGSTFKGSVPIARDATIAPKGAGSFRP